MRRLFAFQLKLPNTLPESITEARAPFGMWAESTVHDSDTWVPTGSGARHSVLVAGDAVAWTHRAAITYELCWQLPSEACLRHCYQTVEAIVMFTAVGDAYRFPLRLLAVGSGTCYTPTRGP